MMLLICLQFKNLEKKNLKKGKVEKKKEWYDELERKTEHQSSKKLILWKKEKVIQDYS